LCENSIILLNAEKTPRDYTNNFYKTNIWEGRKRARPYGGTWKNIKREEHREVQSLQGYLQSSTVG